MRLDARAFGLAAGAMAALLFTLCAAGVAVAPEAMTALGGTLVHLDMSGMVRTLTWTNFLGGLATWTLLTGLVFAAVAALYNVIAEGIPIVQANVAHRPARAR
jgi:hypothetical protein